MKPVFIEIENGRFINMSLVTEVSVQPHDINPTVVLYFEDGTSIDLSGKESAKDVIFYLNPGPYAVKCQEPINPDLSALCKLNPRE